MLLIFKAVGIFLETYLNFLQFVFAQNVLLFHLGKHHCDLLSSDEHVFGLFESRLGFTGALELNESVLAVGLFFTSLRYGRVLAAFEELEG